MQFMNSWFSVNPTHKDIGPEITVQIYTQKKSSDINT